MPLCNNPHIINLPTRYIHDMVATFWIASRGKMSRFLALVSPPGLLAFSHQNDSKTAKETADAAIVLAGVKPSAVRLPRGC
jgi:hypothetical protein